MYPAIGCLEFGNKGHLGGLGFRVWGKVVLVQVWGTHFIIEHLDFSGLKRSEFERFA